MGFIIAGNKFFRNGHYAAMWDVRREPHNFRSGGPGSGLFKSTDAGATWHELRKGFPEGDLGRIGIGIAASNPKDVGLAGDKNGDRSARACQECGKCLPKCPNKVAIIAQLKQTAKLLGAKK